MSADGSTAPITTLLLDVDDLLDSPFQPFGRSARDVEPLSQAIAESGLLAPLVVRPLVNDKHEIVEGHRRREAVRILGWSTVPCIVRDLSDQQAAIIVLAGNGQRLDLAPLEETAIIEQLVERGLTPEAVAEKIGKSLSLVRRRLLLAKLSEEAKAALHSGKLTLFAAEQIATISDARDAANVLRDLVQQAHEEPAGRRQALNLIDLYRRPLAGAPWGLQDASLGAPACVACPKRTGAQAALFDEGIEGGDSCLDRTCYEAKLATYRERGAADDGNAGDGGREEEPRERPTKSRSSAASTSSVPLTPPTKPAVDYERQAREAAIDRTIPLIAKSLAKPARKLDDPKIWKLFAGFVVRGARGPERALVDAVLERRGLPLVVGSTLTAIGAIKDPHEVAGLLGEMLVAVDAEWTGEETCETSIAAAARFCKIDLMVHKSDALIELHAAAKPKPAEKPAEKPAKKAKTETLVEAPPVALDQRIRVKAGPFEGRIGVVGELLASSAVVLLDRLPGERGRDRRPTLAFANLSPLEESSGSAPSNEEAKPEEPRFEVNDRVRITGGDYRGRVGRIDARPKLFPDAAMVLIDLRDKERVNKTPMIELKNLEPEAPPEPVEKAEPKRISPDLAAECPRCHAVAGAPCDREGGGTHAERGKVRGKPPLDVACGKCGANRADPCRADNGRATKPHQPRIEASIRAAAKLDESAPAGEDLPPCRTCGCTAARICPGPNGECSKTQGDLCSACAGTMQAIEEYLHEGRTKEEMLVAGVETVATKAGETYIDETRIRVCLDELVRIRSVARLPNDFVALQPGLPGVPSATSEDPTLDDEIRTELSAGPSGAGPLAEILKARVVDVRRALLRLEKAGVVRSTGAEDDALWELVPASIPTQKRGRGRPTGSKNKKGGAK